MECCSFSVDRTAPLLDASPAPSALRAGVPALRGSGAVEAPSRALATAKAFGVLGTMMSCAAAVVPVLSLRPRGNVGVVGKRVMLASVGGSLLRPPSATAVPSLEGSKKWPCDEEAILVGDLALRDVLERADRDDWARLASKASWNSALASASFAPIT